MLVLLKNHLNCLKDNIVECSFKNHKRLYFMKKKLFFIIYSDGKSKAGRRKQY